MHIEYAISLWNYFHYANLQSLERELALIRDQGYGVEVWGWWQAEKDLFDEVGRARLRAALREMTVTLHTALVETFEQHKKQVDAAVDLGAKVLVLHPSDMARDDGGPDIPLARDVMAYAAGHGVRLALENGPLPFLVQAIEAVDGLEICLDVGHVYQTPDPMSRFLDALRDRLIHLHLQDTLSEPEKGLPRTGGDHYIPGTGGIPEADWRLLVDTLQAIDFDGIAVFEIRPRNPLQTALLATRFMDRLLKDTNGQNSAGF